jgi:hypothetical protein
LKGFLFHSGPCIFLRGMKKPTNALIIKCNGTQYSPTCFGTLKCYHQGVKHDPAEIVAQCGGKQRRVGSVYCNRRHDGRDNILLHVSGG